MRERSFSDEQDGGSDNAAGEGAGADTEYAFDGFRVMFSEKIMLTPAAPLLPVPAPEPSRAVH